jgi:hypothetical protein
LLALNLHRVGRRRSTQITIISTVIGTIGLSLLVMFLPTDFPNLFLPAVIGGIFSLAYGMSFQSQYKEHIQAGVARASNWAALGVSLAGASGVLVLFLVVALTIPIRAMNHATFADNTIYYEGRATRQDALELGEFLTQQGMFYDGSFWDVTLVFPASRVEEVVIKVAMERPGVELRDAITKLIDDAQRGIYSGRRVLFEVQNAFGVTVERISYE